MPRHVQEGMALTPQTALDERGAKTHPCDPSIKKKKICAGSVQPEVSRIRHVASATLPSLEALMIEHRRRFGVIFIYLFNLKPLCLSLSSRKPVTLGRAW